MSSVLVQEHSVEVFIQEVFFVLLPDAAWYKRACTPESKQLLEFLDKSATWLKTWQVTRNKDGKNVTNNFSFIEGFQRDIAAVKAMTAELHAQGKIKYLCTRRLSSDPIENFFSIVRGRRGFDQNPSCLAFAQAFKQSITN